MIAANAADCRTTTGGSRKDFCRLRRYYALSAELRRKIRTTNVLERTLMRSMQIFPNPEHEEDLLRHDPLPWPELAGALLVKNPHKIPCISRNM